MSDNGLREALQNLVNAIDLLLQEPSGNTTPQWMRKPYLAAKAALAAVPASGAANVREFAKPGQIPVNAPTCDKCGKIFLDCQCAASGAPEHIEALESGLASETAQQFIERTGIVPASGAAEPPATFEENKRIATEKARSLHHGDHVTNWPTLGCLICDGIAEYILDLLMARDAWMEQSEQDRERCARLLSQIESMTASGAAEPPISTNDAVIKAYKAGVMSGELESSGAKEREALENLARVCEEVRRHSYLSVQIVLALDALCAAREPKEGGR